ncbi:MAG TPA: DUF2784 domain-containing protein [Gemmataceae bacterium]|jgi:hypothetical protein|nr:DUF2784 domain-containing protein [Gemmataceae bacterium]
MVSPPDEIESKLMWYAFLADAVVVAHIAYVGYVVLGQLAIWLGWIFHRQWARNFWFRATHLLAIAIVALEAVMGWTCPLTRWENQLRELAGQTTRSGSFMGRLAHDVLFGMTCPEWAFNCMHVGFAVLVLGTFVLFPPRWPLRSKRAPLPVNVG